MPPVPRDLAAELARTVAAHFAAAETRLLDALTRQVSETIRAEHVDLAAAYRTIRERTERALARLQADATGTAQKALLEAWATGAHAAVDELHRLGGETRLGWWARRSRILAALARLTGITRRREAVEVRELAALRTALPGIDAAMVLLGELTQRFSSTHLRVLRWQQDAYRTAVTSPALDIITGTKTRLRATQVMWDTLTAQGITGFEDRKGRHWDLTSYAEMATRTASSHAEIEGHLDQLRREGHTIAQVTDSPEECERCRPWEGKIVAIVGPAGPRQMEHAIEDGLQVTVDVTATLAEAILAGLFHPNCTHRLRAYLPGITRTPTDTENEQGYDDRQELRRLERKVRKAKRRAAAAMTPEARQAWEKKVRAAQQEIRDHVDSTSAVRRPDREQLAPDTPDPIVGPVRPPEPPPTPPAPPVLETAPPAPEAPAIDHTPALAASDRTQALIDQARTALPTDADGWDAPVAVKRRRVEQEIHNYEDKIKRWTAELESATGDKADEIRTRLAYARDHLETYVYPFRDVTPETAENSRGEFWAAESTEHVYPTDTNGRKLPPPEYEAWLDHVLAVGDALHNDIEAAFAADEERQRLRAPILTEIYSSDQWNAMARREAEIIRDVLGSVRPLGGHEQTLGTAEPGTTGRWRDLIREAEQVYPTDWLRLADDRGALHAKPVDRAHFDAGGHGGEDLMAFDGEDRWGGTAFTSGEAETTAHEIGHRMEVAVPGLTHLEYTLVRRRSMSGGVLTPPESLKTIDHAGYDESELTYQDEWPVLYMGKTYGERSMHPASSPGELFTVALQSLFGRSEMYNAGPIGHRFALGVLAVLGGRPRG